jgi:hypothetical protein
MPTVTAADEALSSRSQNAAYRPVIMAAQIRSAKAQAEIEDSINQGRTAFVTAKIMAPRGGIPVRPIWTLRPSVQPSLWNVSRNAAM